MRHISVDGELAAERGRLDLVAVLSAEALGEKVPDQGLAIPEPARRGQLVVPSTTDLETALAKATTREELVAFDSMMSVLEEAGRQFDIAIDEAIRIAAFHLTGKRKLGLALLHRTNHGGDRSRSHAANVVEEGQSRLIDKDRRRRYKALARVQADLFENYLKVRSEQHEIPKEAGVLRYAAKASGKVHVKPGKRRSRERLTEALDLSPAVLDAIGRFLGEIDVCIGDAKLRCDTRLSANTVNPKQIRGRVVVSECLDPVGWLPKLVRLRANGVLEEVLVVLLVETGAPWFRGLAEQGWSCCFLTGPTTLSVAYQGARQRLFHVGFQELGAVMRSAIM
jgi:hypothetical protein